MIFLVRGKPRRREAIEFSKIQDAGYFSTKSKTTRAIFSFKLHPPHFFKVAIRNLRSRCRCQITYTLSVKYLLTFKNPDNLKRSCRSFSWDALYTSAAIGSRSRPSARWRLWNEKKVPRQKLRCQNTSRGHTTRWRHLTSFSFPCRFTDKQQTTQTDRELGLYCPKQFYICKKKWY